MALRELDNDQAFEFYRSFLEFYGRWLRPQSYLEIGLATGDTFRRLIPYCEQMTGIDPNVPDLGTLNPKCRLLPITSDEYFRDYPNDTYDLVFIDGLHESEQVTRDIRNALHRLRPNGLVVAHDTFPPSPELTNPQGCGDAYKAAIELRKDRCFEVYTFPVRYGVTLIGKIGATFPWIPLAG